MKRILFFIAAVALVAACAAQVPEGTLKHVTPESMGMNSAKLNQIDREVARAIEEGNIPGCVVSVVRGDKIVFLKAYGNKQVVPDTIPMTTETMFDLASVSKCVGTTLSFMQLIENGYVRLTDDVDMYIPDFKPWIDPATGEKVYITVQDVMTHTSGLSPQIALYNVCESPDDAVRTILDSTPLGRPGEAVRYSCMGYILFQRILETVAGAPLDKLANELVFSPLGMKTACFNPLSRPDRIDPAEADIAATELSRHTGYYIVGHVHDENAHFLGGTAGNAGVFASLDDMTAFAKMLSNRGSLTGKRFLNRRTFELAIRDYTIGLAEDRGYGFSLRRHDLSASGEFTTPGSYGHNGYTGTSVYCDARTGVAAVLLTNSVHYGRDNRGPFFRDRRIFHNVVLTEADRALGLDLTDPAEPWGAASYFD